MKSRYLVLIILFTSSIYADSYGRLLLYGNCITCHHETKNISAPSLQIIKKRYHEAFGDKKEFVDYMVNWVYKPSSQTSIMHDMVEKYALMPELGYDKDTLEKIATYLYELK